MLLAGEGSVLLASIPFLSGQTWRGQRLLLSVVGPRCSSSASGGGSRARGWAVHPVSTARRLRAFTYAEPAASNLDFGPSWNGALQAEHCGGGCHGNCAGNDDPCHLGAVGRHEPRLRANRAAIASHKGR